VNQIIQEAMRDRATDIHVEPMEKELRIRYRIDGMLYEAPIPPAIKRFQAAIISRLKIMADLNIAERRLPQDGKIKLRMGDNASSTSRFDRADALRRIDRHPYPFARLEL
jgi:general secretion pathway protein E